MTAIEKAAELVGSQKKLAELLHVSKAAVNQWKLPGRKVPTIHCPAIEEATKGIVRCEDLRPDLNWVILRPSLKPHTVHTRAANGDAFGNPLKRRAEDKIDEKESA
jgi:DNA-binding transcriptional regulator YdaS (Cro superfamily)